MNDNILIILLSRCRASQDCPAFLIDYDNAACYRLDTNTDDNREIIRDTERKTNYFEKICLNGKNCIPMLIYILHLFSARM